jgi:hypothetical protein
MISESYLSLAVWDMIWSHSALSFGCDIKRMPGSLLLSPFMSAGALLTEVPQQRLEAAVAQYNVMKPNLVIPDLELVGRNTLAV